MGDRGWRGGRKNFEKAVSHTPQIKKGALFPSTPYPVWDLKREQKIKVEEGGGRSGAVTLRVEGVKPFLEMEEDGQKSQ